MTSLIETLIALGTGLALGLAALMKTRNRTDLREQIKQDVELRKMLDESSDKDAHAALTTSIRNNAQGLTRDEPDWFNRWGIQWILPGGAILFFAGMSLRGLVDDFETAPGTQLALEVTGMAMMLISGPLIGLWLSRLLLVPFFEWFFKRRERKATGQSSPTD